MKASTEKLFCVMFIYIKQNKKNIIKSNIVAAKLRCRFLKFYVFFFFLVFAVKSLISRGTYKNKEKNKRINFEVDEMSIFS